MNSPLPGLLLALALALPVARAQDDLPPEAPPAVEVPAVPDTPPSPPEAPVRDPRGILHLPSHSGDPMVVIGNRVVVKPNETVAGLVVINGRAELAGRSTDDVVLINSTATITGEVAGDTVMILSRVQVDGRLDGDTVAVLSKLSFGSNAVAQGETVLVGTRTEMAEGAQVRTTPVSVNLGPLNILFDHGQDYLRRGLFWLRPFPPGVKLAWVLVGLVFLLRLLTAAVLPGPTRFTANLAATQPLRCFLVGLLTMALLPLALLLLTVVTLGLGGPIVPFVILAVVALNFFGRTAVFAALGGGLSRLPGLALLTHPLPATAAGGVLVYLAYMIPVAGGVLFLLLYPFALGAGVLAVHGAFRRERPGPDTFRPAQAIPSPATAASGLQAAGFAAGSVAPSVAADVPPPPALSEPPPQVPLPPPRPPAFDSAELLSQPRAGFWPRTGAALIDLLVVAMLNAFLPGPARLFWLLLAAYHVCFWMWRGTTPGGIILGLRVIRTDARALTWPVAIVRAVSGLISLLPAGLGFLWVLWDPNRQSWHDRIAGTTIVRTSKVQPLV